MTNPYETPEASNARLSRREIHFLEFRLAHRDRLPTLASYARYQGWATQMVFPLAFVALVVFVLGKAAGILTSLVVVGSAAQELAWFRVTRRGWYLVQETTDWQRIEHLLSGEAQLRGDASDGR